MAEVVERRSRGRDRGVRRATRGKKGAQQRSAQHHAAQMTQRTLTLSTGKSRAENALRGLFLWCLLCMSL